MLVANELTTVESIESIHDKLSDDVFTRLSRELADVGLTLLPDNLSIVAFKKERILEIYTTVNGKHHLIKQYPFSASSGVIGPKLKEGDQQIPEGIYQVESLNPNSNFYLSIKVNFPNEYDKLKAKEDNRTDIGSDIFIHGKDVTVGCIPLGDPAIEEVFLLVSQSIDNEIEVIIAPHDFRVTPMFPEVTTVNWSAELYGNITNRLKDYIS